MNFLLHIRKSAGSTWTGRPSSCKSYDTQAPVSLTHAYPCRVSATIRERRNHRLTVSGCMRGGGCLRSGTLRVKRDSEQSPAATIEGHMESL